MLQHLREGGEPPSFVNCFASPMDNLVKEAWEEQHLIGWDQLLKGRISSKWGKAQGLSYGNNLHTRHEKHFTEQVWVAKVIASLLRFTLGLWKDRCDVLHGANLEERNRIKRDKTLGKLKNRPLSCRSSPNATHCSAARVPSAPTWSTRKRT